MPRAKLPVKTPLTFKEYLEKFEPKVLQGAVVQLNDSIAWELMRGYLRLKQREFEVAALDLACHDGHSLEAAKASGLACALDEVANKYMQDLINAVNGLDGYVEGPIRNDQES